MFAVLRRACRLGAESSNRVERRRHLLELCFEGGRAMGCVGCQCRRIRRSLTRTSGGESSCALA